MKRTTDSLTTVKGLRPRRGSHITVLLVSLILGLGDTAAATPALETPQLFVFEATFAFPAEDSQRALYDDLLHSALSAHSGLRVIGNSEVQAFVSADDEFNKARDCGGPECFMSLHEFATVRFFMNSTFSKVDQRIVVSSKIYDRRSGSVAVRRMATLGTHFFEARDLMNSHAEDLAEDLEDLTGDLFDTANTTVSVPPASQAVPKPPALWTSVTLWLGGGVLVLASASAGVALMKSQDVDESGGQVANEQAHSYQNAARLGGAVGLSLMGAGVLGRLLGSDNVTVTPLVHEGTGAVVVRKNW